MYDGCGNISKRKTTSRVSKSAFENDSRMASAELFLSPWRATGRIRKCSEQPVTSVNALPSREIRVKVFAMRMLDVSTTNAKRLCGDDVRHATLGVQIAVKPQNNNSKQESLL